MRRSRSSSRAGASCFRSSATSWPRPKARWISQRATTPSSATSRRRHRGNTHPGNGARLREGLRPLWLARRTNGPRSSSPSVSPPTIATPAAPWKLQFLQGERHTFVNEHPFSPNLVKAVEMAKAFIKKYGSPKTSSITPTAAVEVASGQSVCLQQATSVPGARDLCQPFSSYLRVSYSPVRQAEPCSAEIVRAFRHSHVNPYVRRKSSAKASSAYSSLLVLVVALLWQGRRPRHPRRKDRTMRGRMVNSIDANRGPITGWYRSAARSLLKRHGQAQARPPQLPVAGRHRHAHRGGARPPSRPPRRVPDRRPYPVPAICGCITRTSRRSPRTTPRSRWSTAATRSSTAPTRRRATSCTASTAHLNETLGLRIRVTEFKGDLHLAPEEKQAAPDDSGSSPPEASSTTPSSGGPGRVAAGGGPLPRPVSSSSRSARRGTGTRRSPG